MTDASPVALTRTASGAELIGGAGGAAPVAVTPRIALEGVSVRYHGALALDSINLAVAPGEVVVLLGPSGSGKSTILRAIAGFVTPSQGRISLAGRDVTDLPPHARGVGMVVQNYALFPHLRVAENVGFGLRARRRPAADITERVAACLDMVGMGRFADRLPRELSGGQQQRVAIARALAIDPPVLLLDEPLSALDAPLRAGLLEEIRALLAGLPDLEIVYLSHAQNERMGLGDRILLIRDGRIAAEGTPRALHDTPPHRYAAEFFGQANLLPVQLDACDAELAIVTLEGQRLTVRAPAWHASDDRGDDRGDDRALGARPLLCLRPHAITLNATGLNRIEARILATHWMGAVNRIEAAIGPHRLRIDVPGSTTPPAPGSVVTIGFDPDQACLVADL